MNKKTKIPAGIKKITETKFQDFLKFLEENNLRLAFDGSDYRLIVIKGNIEDFVDDVDDGDKDWFTLDDADEIYLKEPMYILDEDVLKIREEE